MVPKNELIGLINRFSLPERIRIIEVVLKKYENRRLTPILRKKIRVQPY